MMRRSGEVASLADGRAVVRFERATACGSCHAAKVCGTASITELSVETSATHCPGERVEVEIEAGAALRALAVTHLLPLAGLLAGMACGVLLVLSDAGVAGLSFAGLGLGLIASRRLARHPAIQPLPRISSASHCAPANTHQEPHR